MSADVKNNGDSRLTIGSSRAPRPSAKFLRLTQFHRLRKCEQVAAVCYRISSRGIEFLLVQTRGGRWTFPKGGVEAGLTHAQAAALEAFEEAGVHGRIEEASFARYVRRKRGDNSPAIELVTNAHLCEVLRLGPPQESKRHPKWFSAERAKRRLREDRTPDDGAELARVVDRAVNRIERLRSTNRTVAGVSQRDGLQKVQFEAFDETGIHARMEQGRMREASKAPFMRHVRRQHGDLRHAAAIELAVNAHLSKVLRFAPLPAFNQLTGVVERDLTRVPRLGSGTNAAGAVEEVKSTQMYNAGLTTVRDKASGPSTKNRRNGIPIDWR